MSIDDSFKKPGAVPFKWEIRPGVPKLHNPSPPSDLEFQNQSPLSIHNSPLPETPPKLKPPPAGFYYFQSEPRSYSFGSTPRTRSLRFGMPGFTRPDIVSSAGCFPSPLVKRKNEKKRIDDHPGSEPEYYSDLDIPARWSVSSRRSVSPLSSSFASYKSSPRPVPKDAEWAAFGLF
ncbi:hypothetical protein BUALT_Bualt08G0116800 [Buddleja alternifolia]|uniref:Uncharacterized protein n=1 Tax=Buddleja alternifolia TaxID=168488 RepID=A0AAV6XC54_9LAMI|nr:hypothetical protein BUALT_Bualt08G0116800 [Buddleja alternifolia]